MPFFLAHGGTQTLLESLIREISGLGIEVEHERWWDDQQSGDIIHYMNRPVTKIIRLAHDKGFKTVMTENLDQTASRTGMQLFAQRSFTKAAKVLLPESMRNRFGWEVYQEIDAVVYVVEHEWEVAKYLFDARPDCGHIIPHGLDDVAVRELAKRQNEEDYLISVATIHPRKNSVLLAQAALRAGVPVVFLGKPYADDDPYFLEFKKLVDGKTVRYPGFVSTEEKWRLLRGARGFALLSQFESGCIAVYEAAAAGLPLMLSDLPWAATAYKSVQQAKFTRLGTAESIARELGAFYSGAHRQPTSTFPILTWRQVAEKYVEIYRHVLSRT